MTIHIGNYKSILIDQKQILSYNDIVCFTIDGTCIKYAVGIAFLSCCTEVNDIIFKKLDIDKKTFCTIHYGYSAPDEIGMWPDCRVRDFAALTRVVIALFKKIEEKHISSTDQLKNNYIEIKHLTHLKIIL